MWDVGEALQTLTDPVKRYHYDSHEQLRGHLGLPGHLRLPWHLRLSLPRRLPLGPRWLPHVRIICRHEPCATGVDAGAVAAAGVRADGSGAREGGEREDHTGGEHGGTARVR